MKKQKHLDMGEGRSKRVSFLYWVSRINWALGLILPQATKIAPVLTPIAAVGLAAIVFFGAIFHIRRKEYRDIGVNIVFLALALFVAIGRF
ncbi:DoxX family protein [Peribacillus psychrosaccharolyticus]|uniref:DoxX family protein n=1 Tax=Peribacillus psychrosaccharolyticus TaxID=1407 RepID=UPI003D2C00B4